MTNRLIIPIFTTEKIILLCLLPTKNARRTFIVREKSGVVKSLCGAGFAKKHF
jgi:hypothetical protein